MSRNGEIYRLFSSAWAERDIEALLALVTEDIIYGASVGPEPGETFAGRDAVATGFAKMLGHDEATKIEVTHYDEIDDRAYAQWKFMLGDGSEIRGVDVIEFREGRISVKQGFRKAKG